jgi:hypothetical protein
MLPALLLGVVLRPSAWGTFISFQEAGAIAGDSSTATAWKNGGILNETLASMRPGDTLHVENTSFYVMGGIRATNLTNVTIQIDGTLLFSDDLKAWPRGGDGKVLPSLYFDAPKDVVFTSSGVGTLNGQGGKWWGIPGIGYLIRTEDRPRLFHMRDSKNILVENLFFLNSAYWTFLSDNSDGLEVRFCDISARRDHDDGHDIIDITAFNTDGYDVTGRNVWIHDSSVWNQDDCIAVKDGSENMVFERIHASGLGLTIGSIGGSNVRNITFRDCVMHNTVKGIYLKFRGPGNISDVTFDNITIDGPSQGAIWIGPAQQSDSRELCAPHPCSICWPQLKTAKCGAPFGGQYTNITLRNVNIDLKGKVSPGLIFANSSTPIKNIVFDNVVVTNPGSKPFGSNYYCEGVESGVAMGTTSPVPPCFQDLTDSAAASR